MPISTSPFKIRCSIFDFRLSPPAPSARPLQLVQPVRFVRPLFTTTLYSTLTSLVSPRTCAWCHFDRAQRVEKSIQTPHCEESPHGAEDLGTTRQSDECHLECRPPPCHPDRTPHQLPPRLLLLVRNATRVPRPSPIAAGEVEGSVGNCHCRSAEPGRRDRRKYLARRPRLRGTNQPINHSQIGQFSPCLPHQPLLT